MRLARWEMDMMIHGLNTTETPGNSPNRGFSIETMYSQACGERFSVYPTKKRRTSYFWPTAIHNTTGTLTAECEPVVYTRWEIELGSAWFETVIFRAFKTNLITIKLFEVLSGKILSPINPPRIMPHKIRHRTPRLHRSEDRTNWQIIAHVQCLTYSIQSDTSTKEVTIHIDHQIDSS
ncbi:hypothetical protein WG66_002309 [Moniliophthora roreri]|nr:hypothetical protein WG66_002309 [Moniliophthora roreri]